LNVIINAFGHIVPAIFQPGAVALSLRSMLVVVSFCVSFFCKSLIQMFELVASVTVASTMIYLNLGCYFGAAIKSESPVKVVWHAIVFVAGLVATVAGLKAALFP